MSDFRTIGNVIDKVKETLEQKENIYGPTYHRVAVMLSVKPQYSILVRILEKAARAHNIIEGNKFDAAHLQEEFIDIACYAILAAFESSIQPEL